VTNHGFKNGRPFELQSILAEGTAVLIDKEDNIVTRCYCGNPIKPPKSQGSSTCIGCPKSYVPPPVCSGKDCYKVDERESAGGKGDDEKADADEEDTGGTRSIQSRPSRDPGGSGSSPAAPPTPSVYTYYSGVDSDSSDPGDSGDSGSDADDDEPGVVNAETPPPNAVEPCSEANPCVEPG
jgi:hypothetical protein